MKLFKVILALLILVLAVFGAFAVFAIVAGLLKYLVFFGVLLLVGAVAYKALKKSDRSPEYMLNEPESDLARADRLIEDLRRKQLTR